MPTAWAPTLALAAGVIVTLAVLPQLVKALRSDAGLATQSVSRHLAAALGNGLWGIYAHLVGVTPLLVMASISVVLNGILAGLIVRARLPGASDRDLGLGS